MQKQQKQRQTEWGYAEADGRRNSLNNEIRIPNEKTQYTQQPEQCFGIRHFLRNVPQQTYTEEKFEVIWHTGILHQHEESMPRNHTEKIESLNHGKTPHIPE